MTKHDDEVARLAIILDHNQGLWGWGLPGNPPRLDPRVFAQIVREVLDNYHPRVEWRMIPAPSADDQRFDPTLHPYPTREARLRVGSRVFDFKQKIHPRDAGNAHRDEHLRRHMMTALGRAVAEWADSKEGD